MLLRCTFKRDWVKKVDLSKRPFKLFIGDSEVIETEVLIQRSPLLPLPRSVKK